MVNLEKKHGRQFNRPSVLFIRLMSCSLDLRIDLTLIDPTRFVLH